MNIKENITFFHKMEEFMWTDKKVGSNKYLATISILYVAFIAVILSGGSTLHSWFGWDTESSLIGAVATCIFIGGLNIGESILVCEKLIDALFRSLYILGCMVVIYFFSYWLTTIMMVVLAIEIGLLAISGGISGLSEYNEKHGEKEWELSNGEKIRGSLNPGGNSVHGCDGRDYPIQ